MVKGQFGIWMMVSREIGQSRIMLESGGDEGAFEKRALRRPWGNTRANGALIRCWIVVRGGYEENQFDV